MFARERFASCRGALVLGGLLVVAALVLGAAVATVSGSARAGGPSASDLKRRDAVLALISLGYKQPEALRMVNTAVPGDAEDLSVEEIVRRALTVNR